jgi:hypothetical protein
MIGRKLAMIGPPLAMIGPPLAMIGPGLPLIAVGRGRSGNRPGKEIRRQCCPRRPICDMNWEPSMHPTAMRRTP